MSRNTADRVKRALGAGHTRQTLWRGSICLLCAWMLMGLSPTVAEQTPFLLDDIAPGALSSGARMAMAVGDKFFFAASDLGTSQRELWVTEGTPGSAHLVKKINPSGSSSLSDFCPFAGFLLFTAKSSSSGPKELWRSAGDESNTEKLGYSSPGATVGYPRDVRMMGDVVYFTDGVGTSGQGLWKSDGASAGTELLRYWLDRDQQTIKIMGQMGDTVFFRKTAKELWKTDGTPEGTVLVKNSIGIYTTDNEPESAAALNGFFYFPAGEYDNYELWRSDGTAEGTGIFKIINPVISTEPSISSDSRVHSLKNFGGRLYFSAFNGLDGDEPWTSDGTAAGTVMIKDMLPGPYALFLGGSMPHEFTALGHWVFFVARAENGIVVPDLLCRTDGTEENTTFFGNLQAKLDNTCLISCGTLYFSADDGAHGWELWRTNGTEAGTMLVADINPDGDSSPYDFAEGNGLLVFSADDGVHGKELWALNLPPYVASVTLADPSPTNAASVAFTVTFSEAVTGVDAGDFRGVADGLAESPVTGVSSVDDRMFTVTVAAGAGEGTLGLELVDDDSILDTYQTPLEGPGTPVGDYLSASRYVIDRTGPTVLMASLVSDPVDESPLPVTVYFTEAVTGFTAEDVVLGNGELSGFAGGGQGYSFLLTPLGPGIVTAEIPADAATDAAGNGNQASDTFSWTIPDAEGEGGSEGALEGEGLSEGEGEGVVEGEGEGVPEGEGEVPGEASLIRTVAEEFTPGTALEVTLTSEFPEGVTPYLVQIQETLPEGWVYLGMVSGTAPTTGPEPGATGVLAFEWYLPPFPEPPEGFQYRVMVPLDQAGIVSISGVLTYHTFAGMYALPPVVSRISKAAPPAEGEVEGAAEGQADGEGTSEGEWEGSICKDQGEGEPEMVLIRETASRYTPGENLEIAVTIDYSNCMPLMTLYLRETLPAGWKYAGVTSAFLIPIKPPSNATGTLEFAWEATTMPDFPAQFTYRVLVPATQTGAVQISGQIQYRLDGGPLYGDTVVSTIKAPSHAADQDGDGAINLTELLRVIQFFNIRAYCCAAAPDASEDGYLPGAGGEHACAAHSSDYAPQDWQINLTELLRLIQFFNMHGYHACPADGTEDGYCPGAE